MRLPTILLLLASTLAAQQSPGAFDADEPGFSAGTRGSVKIFHLGPFTVPAGRLLNGVVIPGEYEPLFSLPRVPNPGNVFMTGYDSRVVDRNRNAVDDAEIYLHHAVLVNRSVGDLTCGFIGGERFAAAGEERIPLALPQGYGYRLYGNEQLFCLLHLQNFTLQSKSVYYQYSMTLVDGNAGLTRVRPWWLDIVNCLSSYTVPAGTGLDIRTRNYTVPGKVTMLELGPHLHCGGTKLEFYNVTTGQTIRNFSNTSCPISMQPHLPVPFTVLPRGTQISLRATYQKNPTKQIDAMGILLSYIVLN